MALLEMWWQNLAAVALLEMWWQNCSCCGLVGDVVAKLLMLWHCWRFAWCLGGVSVSMWCWSRDVISNFTFVERPPRHNIRIYSTVARETSSEPNMSKISGK